MERNCKNHLLLCLVDRTQDIRTEKRLLESYKHLGVLNRQVSILLTLNKKCNKKNSKKIMDYIIGAAQKLSKAKIVAIYKLNKNEKVFQLISGVKDAVKLKNEYENLSLNKSQSLKPILSGMRSQGNSEDLKLEEFSNDGLSYFLALPLSNNKNIDGMIFLGFDDRSETSTQELEFYEAFAAQVSLTMENFSNLKQCRLALPN